MTIYGLKDLEYYRLREGDIVIFYVKDKQCKFVDLNYEVHSNFLMNVTNIHDTSFLMNVTDIHDTSPSDKYYNDEIFTILGLDPYKFCTKHYGYEPTDGIWPCCKDWDFEAITNVVKALYTLIDTMNGEWLRVKGDCSITSAASTPLRFMTQGTTSCRNPHQESLSDLPIDKLKKIASQIKTIKEDNNSKLKII